MTLNASSHCRSAVSVWAMRLLFARVAARRRLVELLPQERLEERVELELPVGIGREPAGVDDVSQRLLAVAGREELLDELP